MAKLPFVVAHGLRLPPIPACLKPLARELPEDPIDLSWANGFGLDRTPDPPTDISEDVLKFGVRCPPRPALGAGAEGYVPPLPVSTKPKCPRATRPSDDVTGRGRWHQFGLGPNLGSGWLAGTRAILRTAAPHKRQTDNPVPQRRLFQRILDHVPCSRDFSADRTRAVGAQPAAQRVYGSRRVGLTCDPRQR